MGSTANYSWPTPEATDLVKDGWEAIKDLGDAIDTTVFDNSPGLKHIETQNPSGVSSFSFSNDVFTSTFTDYVVIFSVINSIDNQSLTIRLRAAGSDASGSNYDRAGIGYDTGNTAVTLGTTSQTLLSLGGNSNTDYSGGALYILKPNNTTRTSFTFSGRMVVNGNHGQLMIAGRHTLSTAYDSLTIASASGNLTGEFKLFGIKK